jgi:Protein of unknown function (DUF3891)
MVTLGKPGPAVPQFARLPKNQHGRCRRYRTGSAMIVQDQGNELVLIRQTDHAMLAGFLARRWGNDLFRRPEPFRSFCLAAAEHDNGWTEWEMQPEVDSVTFTPYDFISIPTAEHIELYRRGIERVVKADHYAGLLVSLHCADLYDRSRATLPGYSAKYVKSGESQLVNDFIQRLKLQQLRLKVDLRADPATKDFADEKILQANLKRLEALDCLSLYFSQVPLGEHVIEGVPVDDSGSEADWELRPDGENCARLSPYPFGKDPLDISLLARRVTKRPYTGSEDLRKALTQASYFGIKFTLRAGRKSAFARVVGM